MFNISRRKTGALAAALISLALAPQAIADDGQTLLIKDFIGTVTITTGETFSVSGETGNINTVRENGLIIDGNETIENSACKNVNGNIDISIGKKRWFKRLGGYKDLNKYPKLEISVPPHTHLNIHDSVIFGTGEDFGSADVKIQSCGEFTVGDIAGPLILKVTGSGDFTAADVGESKVRISGSGDVALKDMKSAEIELSGSGDMKASNIYGAAEISVKGSGDIELRDIAGGLSYEGRGSSDFRAQRVNTRASISISGSSEIEIEDGTLTDLRISASGSSEVDFGGSTGSATVTAGGSSEIDIETAKEEIEVKTSGSADVRINGKNYSD